MTALTPTLALEYLKSLSADITDGVILDAQGALVAGPEHLAAPARTFLEHATEGATGNGKVFAAADDKHAIVVTTGPLALPRLTRHDLRKTLVSLGGEPNTLESSSQPATNDLTDALLTASRDTFRRHSAISTSE
jgi:hypothetical protein